MDSPLERSQTNPEDHHISPIATRRQSFQRSRSAPQDVHTLRQVETHFTFMDDYGAHHYHPDHHYEDRDSASPSPVDDEKYGTEPVDEVRGGIRDERDTDLERGRSKLSRNRSSRSAKDPFLVGWDGEDDPENPKNWDLRHRWGATAIVSAFTFISPTSSSMSAPAIPQIGSDLGVSDSTILALMVSIFVLAYAIGPLFLGPLSEIYGRRIVLQLSNLFFLAFNVGCGFATSSGQLIAFRFLSGLGGSAPLAIGGGVLSDCWTAEHRGQAVGIYTLMPLLGPAVGPIAGGWISEKTTWRWCFWSTSLLTVAIQALGMVYLRETYAPVLLSRRAARLRRETGDDRYHSATETPDRTLSKVMKKALSRPFRLLATQPIIQVLAVYMCFLYGVMYLVLTTFPIVWETVYNESVGIGSLNYISLGIGFFIGSQSVARINDIIYRRLKARNNGVGKPEFRAPMIFPGAILVPIGIFIYGWSAEYHTHWIVPNIGAAFFAAGTIASFQCTQTYLVDTYSTFAASAVAAVTVLRSLAGFGFPLFARQMYNTLGLGWGNSVLGFVAIAIGIPAPFMLWFFGERLRERSKFARE